MKFKEIQNPEGYYKAEVTEIEVKDNRMVIVYHLIDENIDHHQSYFPEYWKGSPTERFGKYLEKIGININKSKQLKSLKGTELIIFLELDKSGYSQIKEYHKFTSKNAAKYLSVSDEEETDGADKSADEEPDFDDIVDEDDE